MCVMAYVGCECEGVIKVCGLWYVGMRMWGVRFEGCGGVGG